MKRPLSDSEIWNLKRRLSLDYGLTDIVPPTARVELVDNQVLMIDDEALFLQADGRWAPTVKLIRRSNFLKEIVVDKSTERFVTDGSDLFRKGMIEIDTEIMEREFVAIVDENDRKPIAVGLALTSGNEMKLASKGKMVQNLHHIGDRIWNL